MLSLFLRLRAAASPALTPSPPPVRIRVGLSHSSAGKESDGHGCAEQGGPMQPAVKFSVSGNGVFRPGRECFLFPGGENLRNERSPPDRSGGRAYFAPTVFSNLKS
jgi:hypothetical protein